MSPVDPSRGDPAGFELDERSLLISSCQFDAAQVDSIDDHAASTGHNFTAAAIDLGLVSSREVELILRTVNRQPMPRERAIVLHATGRRALPAVYPRLLPPPAARPGAALAAVALGGSQRGEALRSLRTELLMRTSQERGGIAIAVASAGRGEGRTRLVAEIAASLAQLGRSVLLVDADLRRPRLHALFDSPPACRGLSESLAIERPPQAFGVEGMPSLGVVPAGAASTAALELLSGDFFRAFLAGCRERYEYTLIDTPAADSCADAVAIADSAGCAVLALRAGHSAMARAEALVTRLQLAGTRVLGAALSHY